MRLLTTFVAVLISTRAFAGGPYFDSGTYKGEGWCKTEKGINTLLNSELRIDGWKMAHLAAERKTSSLLDEAFIETQDRGYGIFDVLLDGSKVGWGYCVSSLCHITMTFKNEIQEFNISHNQDGEKITVIWSVQSPNRTVVCEEELQREKQKQGSKDKKKQ